MGWQRQAIVSCATVVVLAGVTSASAGALAADRVLSAPGSVSEGPGAAVDTTAAYQSQVTITLDQPSESCASFPDADGSGRPHQVCGPVLACYRRLNGPQGALGLPTGDERANRYRPTELGERMAPFRGGTVYRHVATGELSVGRWYVSSPSSPSEAPEPAPQC